MSDLISKEKAVNPHANHRKRVRRRFLTEGFDKLEDHVKLELLLFYAIPRRDTNPIAHNLLHRFGSLANVFEAPIEELKKVDGIGESGAMLLKLIPNLARAYMVDKEKAPTRLHDNKTIANYLMQRYIGLANETLTVIALDSKNRVLYCEAVYEGSINTLPLHIKRIVEIAVLYNADSIILAHNHPSGNVMPSTEDVFSTRQVYQALTAIEVRLADHFVIIDGDYFSMAETGFLQQIIDFE